MRVHITWNLTAMQVHISTVCMASCPACSAMPRRIISQDSASAHPTPRCMQVYVKAVIHVDLQATPMERRLPTPATVSHPNASGDVDEPWAKPTPCIVLVLGLVRVVLIAINRPGESKVAGDPHERRLCRADKITGGARKTRTLSVSLSVCLFVLRSNTYNIRVETAPQPCGDWQPNVQGIGSPMCSIGESLGELGEMRSQNGSSR